MVVAAERVLAEHGIAGLTIHRIAEVAGVSIGSLYQYFPHKEAIAAALIDRYVASFVGTATRIVSADPTADPATLMARLGETIAEVFRERHPVHRHLRDLRAVAGKLEPLDRALDTVVQLVAGYLRTRPELAIDPDVAAFTIVHAVDGAINAYAVRQPLPAPLDDPEPLGRELVRMVALYLGVAR